MSKTGATESPLPPLTTGLLHDAFGHLFRRCHLRSQQAFARAFEECDHDLSPLQFGILELVLLNPGISHGALADGMVTAPSVVTTAMKPLRAAGFLVEEVPAGDARRCGYRLSKEGEALFSSASWHIMVAEEMLVGPLKRGRAGNAETALAAAGGERAAVGLASPAHDESGLFRGRVAVRSRRFTQHCRPGVGYGIHRSVYRPLRLSPRPSERQRARAEVHGRGRAPSPAMGPRVEPEDDSGGVWGARATTADNVPRGPLTSARSEVVRGSHRGLHGRIGSMRRHSASERAHRMFEARF